MKRRTIAVFALLLVAATGISLSGCAKKIRADDLTKDIKRTEAEKKTVSGKAADARFSNAQMKFALELFGKTFEEKGDENLLVSPLSVSLALAMTSNGADGETKKQFEELLGAGLDTEELNKYLFIIFKISPTKAKPS